jgi:hypothetical protein
VRAHGRALLAGSAPEHCPSAVTQRNRASRPGSRLNAYPGPTCPSPAPVVSLQRHHSAGIRKEKKLRAAIALRAVRVRNISLGIGQIAADEAAEQPTSETRSSRDCPLFTLANCTVILWNWSVHGSGGRRRHCANLHADLAVHGLRHHSGCEIIPAIFRFMVGRLHPGPSLRSPWPTTFAGYRA